MQMVKFKECQKQEKPKIAAFLGQDKYRGRY